MMDEYEQWQAEVKKLREENEGILKGFQDYLEQSGVSKKTVNLHVGNIEFFANEYLTREDPTSLADGWSMFEGFLGYYLFVNVCGQVRLQPNNILPVSKSSILIISKWGA